MYKNEKSEKIDLDSLPVHVQRALSQEGLSLVKRFSSGHTGNIVLHTKDSSGEEFVIKVPQDNVSQQEVITNISGYEQIIQENISQILPEEYRIGESGGFVYLVTTYLGFDFSSSTKMSLNPNELYLHLKQNLTPLYSSTLKTDKNSIVFINKIKFLLEKNFFNYIIPANLLSEAEIRSILSNIDFPNLYSALSCFAVFDFTPEDIFLKKETIKYPDPKETVRGNPIIDLACFSGVSRDIMNLPGSDYGYDLLKNFAINEVSQIIGIDENTAKTIFYMGRALQYSLSSRFRIQTEPEKAQVFALKSQEYLELVSK